MTGDLARFLPGPRCDASRRVATDRYELFHPEDSIGRVHSFHGNFGMFVRAYTYIRMHGAEGLRRVSEDAVLNANYLRAELREDYDLPLRRSHLHARNGVLSHSPESARRPCSRRRQAHTRLRHSPADRLFPPRRPRSTDDRADRDGIERVVRLLHQRLTADCQEAIETPELVQEAPLTTDFKRLDEVAANRESQPALAPQNRG